MTSKDRYRLCDDAKCAHKSKVKSVRGDFFDNKVYCICDVIGSLGKKKAEEDAVYITSLLYNKTPSLSTQAS
jgi:hypothetical protein